MDKILFSERLVALRKDMGYKSQAALARAYNEKFPPKRRDDAGGNEGDFKGILGTIKNYENPNIDASPKLVIVCNLCQLLDCDVSYLVGDYDERNYPTHKISEYTGLSEDAIKSIKSLKRMSFLLNALNYFTCSPEFKQIVIDLFHFRERLKEAVELAENPSAEQHESIEKLRSAQFMEFLATRNFDELFGRVLKEEIDKSSVIKKSPDGEGFIWQWSFGGKDNG